MKISVVGTGYVGLVSGVCLAEKGHEVVCVDLDRAKVERINEGLAPISEAGLEPMLHRNLGERFRATTDLAQAVRDTELTLVAVGTPFDGAAIDLSQIRGAARQIGTALRSKDGYHVVAVKSTVVPGTTDEVVLPLLQSASGKRAGSDFGVGMNPEFLREGEAVQDFMNPDRIVIGGIDARSQEVLGACYDVFEGVHRITTSNRTAEMIKYTANSLLATLISFSNEIANLSAAIGGVDVVEVMHGVHLDRRLSPILPDGQRLIPGILSYLEAGCGFGGSCFPKDVRALIAHGRKLNAPMRVLNAVMEVNERQPMQVIQRLRRHLLSFQGARIAVLGLAFKPGTDDVRESPALPVLRTLRAQGADLKAYDPVASGATEALLGNGTIRYIDSLEATVDDVDAIVLLTRWPEFERLPELLAGRKLQPLVVDGRRMLDRRRVVRYEGIGI